MRPLKFLLCIIIGVTFCTDLYSQQIPISSQYMFNQLVINPAVAGSSGKFTGRFVNRNQWIGVDGAPVTQTLSMHALIEPVNLGIGGYVFRDQIGPITQTGAQLAAAYHIRLTDDAKLSLGLQGGLFQYKIDVTMLKPADANDQVLAGKNIITSLVPDATFGAYLYTPRFYAGVSVPHLIAGSVKTSDVSSTNVNRHFVLNGGMFIRVSDEIRVEPSVLLRTVTPKADIYSIDINAKVHYLNTIWLGASYRSGDAVVMLLGLKLFERVSFGYSYDITINNLSDYSKGSHEVMLGIDIASRRKVLFADGPSYE